MVGTLPKASSTLLCAMPPVCPASQAAAGPLKGILEVSNEELVSIDFRGNPASSIVDAPLTRVLQGTMAKVFAWYDNEWGYSSRMVDLIHFMAKKDRG